jgi:putative ATPase
MNQPLADKRRPHSLDDFVGQDHLVGVGKPLRLAIEEGREHSFLLWGPPGVGKTTLARMYAAVLDAKLYEVSAVRAGKKDLSAVISDEYDGRKILFVDEIHRFNKAQQDYLLPFVEDGTILLVGATTENPSFEVILALLSRCTVYHLKELSSQELQEILKRAGCEDAEACELIARVSNGDARKALGIYETVLELYGEISQEKVTAVLENTDIRYDKGGEEHYDTISAFIKSMRASQADAAVYYLARMLEGGEDPKFIARRMVIFASEDIGMALPTALVVANEVFRAVETVGLPEAAINLSHGVVYLAQAPKSRASYNALREAQSDVKRFGNLPIPTKIKNPVTKLMKDEGYGKDYEKYDKESYLPEKLKTKKYVK